MFGSLVHGTATPRSVFLAAKTRDTMDKERETARLATLVNLNQLEVKNTQLQIQMLNFFEQRDKKGKRRYKGRDAPKVVGFETGFSDDQNLDNGRT